MSEMPFFSSWREFASTWVLVSAWNGIVILLTSRMPLSPREQGLTLVALLVLTLLFPFFWRKCRRWYILTI